MKRRPSAAGTRRFAWLARAVCIVAMLSQVGMLPRRWRAGSSIQGPQVGSHGRGLEVTVLSTYPPDVWWSAGCADPWVRGQPLICLFPPGTSRSFVGIEGTCEGCEASCVPPADANVIATSKEVDVWQDVVTSTTQAVLPPLTFGDHKFRVEVRASGARAIQVQLRAVKEGATIPLDVQQHVCGASPNGPSCEFLLLHPPFAPHDAVVLVAEATGWGTPCTGPGGAPPCQAPGTLRIDSVTVSATR